MSTLTEDIKSNCDISDARYWGYFSICGLLMRYRDLFRSEQGLEPWIPPERERIARWIQEKEARWPELETQAFRTLGLNGDRYDPFDLDGLNEALRPRGYVYGAGYGMYLKPTFFLGRAVAETEVEGHRVVTTGQEVVRDLFTAPAMHQDRTIYLRLDPLKALLWDRYVQLSPGRCSVLTAAYQAFGIEAGVQIDRAFATALEHMASAYAAVLLRHELAESRTSVPGWKDLLASVQDRKIELYLRAVQDLLADTAEHGPLHTIIDSRDERLLGLFVGLLDGFRRLLAPELGDAYGIFARDRFWPHLDDVRRQCFTRQSALRQEILELAGQADGTDVLDRLRKLIPA